jgi:hypothetical protein
VRYQPSTSAAAVASGRFAREHRFDPTRDYLPDGLLTQPEEWARAWQTVRTVWSRRRD